FPGPNAKLAPDCATRHAFAGRQHARYLCCNRQKPERLMGGSAMPDIKTEFLFKIVLEVPSILDLGETPYGRRRIARIAGGSFEGPKLKGEVLPGGGDWLLLRRDGVLQLDVRLTMQTHDRELIYMTYRGYRHGPQDVIDRLNRG